MVNPFVLKRPFNATCPIWSPPGTWKNPSNQKPIKLQAKEEGFATLTLSRRVVSVELNEELREELFGKVLGSLSQSDRDAFEKAKEALASRPSSTDFLTRHQRTRVAFVKAFPKQRSNERKDGRAARLKQQCRAKGEVICALKEDLKRAKQENRELKKKLAAAEKRANSLQSAKTGTKIDKSGASSGNKNKATSRRPRTGSLDQPRP